MLVMAHRPHHPRNLPRIAARGVDHHLRDDAALFGDNLPLAALAPLNVEHSIMALHRRAQIARAFYQRIAQSRWIAVPSSVVQAAAMTPSV